MRLALVAGVVAVGCSSPPKDWWRYYPTVLDHGPPHQRSAHQRSGCSEGVFTDCNALAKKDPDAARALYSHTCNAGVAEGCYRLSRYLTGDTNKLADLRERACDLGSDDACKSYGATPDVQRALAAYSDACDRGHPVACVVAGRREAIVFDETTSSSAEITCGTTADMLATGYPRLTDFEQPVAPKTAALAQQRYNGLARHWTQSIAYFVERVGKLKEITPALDRCFEYFDERRQLLGDYAVQIARARRGERPQPTLLAELAPYADSMRRLAAIAFEDEHPARKTANVLAGLPLVEAKRVMTELALVEQRCQERAPDAGKTFPTTFDSNRGVHYVASGLHVPAAILEKTDAWCYVGAKRVELMTAALARMKFAEARARPDDDLALVFRDPEALRRSLVAEATMWATELGVPVPADVASQADTLIRELRRRAEWLPQSRVMHAPRTVRDARVERLIATKIAREDGGIIRGLRLSEYREVPEDRARWRMGTIVSQRRGLPFCDERDFTYTEQRAGGAWRSARGIELARSSRPVSCR